MEGEAATLALVRRAAGQLGAQAGEVEDDRLEEGRGGFDGDVIAGRTEAQAELLDARHEQRLAAGDDDVPGAVFGDAGEDGLDCHALAGRLPGREGGITPLTTKIASGGAYERRGDPDEGPFAL